MKIVQDKEIDTAYQLMTDITNIARSLMAQGKYDPFHHKFIWEGLWNEYDVVLDISIKKKSKWTDYLK